MRAMLSRLRARDAALFVLIAGLVAAGVFAAAREAGVGERADAGRKARCGAAHGGPAAGSGEDQGTPPAPLALTLSAPEICETLPAQGFSGGRSYQVTMEPGTSKAIRQVGLSWPRRRSRGL